MRAPRVPRPDTTGCQLLFAQFIMFGILVVLAMILGGLLT